MITTSERTTTMVRHSMVIGGFVTIAGDPSESIFSNDSIWSGADICNWRHSTVGD